MNPKSPKILHTLTLFSLLTLTNTPALSTSPLYFLCGPDEDGCPPEHPSYCGCFPYNPEFGNTPYCMNLDNLTCKPLNQVTTCEKAYIQPDQAHCLATMLQSVSQPPCSLVSYSYCIENQVPLCNENGNAATCNQFQV